MAKEIGYLLLTGILLTVMCVIYFMDPVLRSIGLHFVGRIRKLNDFLLLLCVCIFLFVKHDTLAFNCSTGYSRFEIPNSPDFHSIVDVSQHHAHTGAVSKFLLRSLSGWDVFVYSTAESSQVSYFWNSAVQCFVR